MGKLMEQAFRPLAIGQVEPTGWLANQLQIQANGLTGHLDEFWPDVRDSGWFGGDADSWERAPYWLDGLIPLAFILKDLRLMEKARQRVGMILDRQGEDGWLGPRATAAGGQVDVWSHFLVDKALVQYHEATGEARALEAVQANLRMLLKYLDAHPLFEWGQFRWFEGLIAIYYLYERSGEPWLLKLARKLHKQGFDYPEFYEGEEIAVPTPRRGMWRFDKHVVNTAMAIKAYPLWSRVSGRKADREFAGKMLKLLDRCHGQVTGIFSGDECLAGKNPIQGTELCAVADAMYSLEQAVAVLGDVAMADRLERLAFNAFPATNAPDMWSHQYDQQANQVQCTINPDHQWTTNGPDSNLFGLEPHFGCCTANLHQAWPKFAQHLWMGTPDGGIAAVAYAPSVAHFRSNGIPAKVELVTDYPFRPTLRFRVSVQGSTTFPLMLRIPLWAQGARISGPGMDAAAQAGAFHRIEREWSGTTDLTLELPMRAKLTRRYNNAIAIERGPLVYSLKIAEQWTQVKQDKTGHELPHGDWEIRPTSDWNYAIRVDESNPDHSVSFEERPLGDRPFSPEGAPVVAKVKGRKITWGIKNGWAHETPISPVHSDQGEEDLTLIPYGCTNLRVTEFPVLAPAEEKKP